MFFHAVSRNLKIKIYKVTLNVTIYFKWLWNFICHAGKSKDCEYSIYSKFLRKFGPQKREVAVWKGKNYTIKSFVIN